MGVVGLEVKRGDDQRMHLKYLCAMAGKCVTEVSALFLEHCDMELTA